MSSDTLLIVAMAERCRDAIQAWDGPVVDQPESLRLEHLEWMCSAVVRNADEWPSSRLHRWLGFVQGAMIANRLITLDDAKRMFDAAKNEYGKGVDRDLLDHLDPNKMFQLDIGGQG